MLSSSRSFNIEFLTGAGIWSYLDESKVKSAIKEENISPGSSDLAHVFAHEVGHRYFGVNRIEQCTYVTVNLRKNRWVDSLRFIRIIRFVSNFFTA